MNTSTIRLVYSHTALALKPAELSFRAHLEDAGLVFTPLDDGSFSVTGISPKADLDEVVAALDGVAKAGGLDEGRIVVDDDVSGLFEVYVTAGAGADVQALSLIPTSELPAS